MTAHPFASKTTTRRNRDALIAAGWGVMISPTGCGLDTDGFSRVALDNGAWTFFQKGLPFDETLFRKTLEHVGHRVDWCVAPDIVCGGDESLALSMRWLPRCLDECQQVLIAVQNGMEPHQFEHIVGPRIGVFVGGDTRWKEDTMADWGGLGLRTGCTVHVGRVNTMRRIALCNAARVSSFDGTSASKYNVTLPKLDNARKQSAFNF